MNIQNLSCKYLEVSSYFLQSAQDLQQLSRITVEATFNKGETFTEVIQAADLTTTWTVAAEFNEGMTVENLYIKNIYTNQVYPLLAQEYAITEQGITAMEAAIDSVLSSDYNINGAVQTHTISGGVLTYTITNLPISMIMESMKLSSANDSINEYFTCLESEKYLVSNDHILLTPAFFNMTEFTNGVVHVKLTTITTIDTVNWDETCFFIDCTMRENLIDNISLEECHEEDVHLLMLHYGLYQASNYNCDCDKMYEMFEYLNNNMQITNRNPCGC